MHPLTDALPDYLDANAMRQACGEIEAGLTRQRDDAHASLEDADVEIAKLKRERDEARERRDWWKRNCAASSEIETNLVVERDALRAEVKALRKDAARYRWLKTATKHEYLLARGAFGLDDDAIDAALTPAEVTKT